MRAGEDDLLGYGPPGGLPDLKLAVAMHLRDHRGIRCESDQIVITAGAQQAFVLMALTLLEPGAVAWSEDPGHIGFRDAARALGVGVKSVPIDDQGLDLELRRQPPPCRQA